MIAEHRESPVEPISLVARTQEAPDPSSSLTEPLRVRVTSDIIDDLNHAEAYFRGQGYRHASRSHLIRIAVASLIEKVHEEHPEIFE